MRLESDFEQYVRDMLTDRGFQIDSYQIATS